MSERLSQTMRVVLTLMGEGWHLCKSTAHGLGRSCWLQNPDTRSYHASRTVSRATFRSLRERGMILPGAYDFPTMLFHLSDRGRLIAEAPPKPDAEKATK